MKVITTSPSREVDFSSISWGTVFMFHPAKSGDPVYVKVKDIELLGQHENYQCIGSATRRGYAEAHCKIVVASEVNVTF